MDKTVRQGKLFAREGLCLLIKNCVQYHPVIFKTPVAILIVKIALLLILASLAVFISADLLLWLDIKGFAELMTRIGLASLLSAFVLLLIAGLFVILKFIFGACFDYFSASQRLQRKLWFIQAQQDRFKLLFYFKTLQINYFHELNRKRLLMANNRQHIQSLSCAIDKDLRSIKQQLSKTAYQQLHQKNVRCREQQDIEALLKLQQQIAAIV